MALLQHFFKLCAAAHIGLRCVNAGDGVWTGIAPAALLLLTNALASDDGPRSSAVRGALALIVAQAHGLLTPIQN
ncbi:hypothetical protein [Metallibacterium scheffleri]|uniref:Uncharacterized protein n=1 Tax=Metallibacterium scheffleri TaxID=993689 RepID=A0A4S3KH49_9GAMM|nr:hypothetical protein [Metallibacterium scheffleri]THD08012.1 hypothetical protein B1806_13900 [Metallibacterium scheffleri]